MNARTGGPAFPHPGGASDSTVQESHLGMDLRDYLAAKAMQGVLANPAIFDRYGFTNDMADESMHAYKVADAMLKARQS